MSGGFDYQSSLSDAEFMQQFEQQTLDPAEFNHKGHLRIAWLYLQTEELDAAIDKVCGGIKRYAESLGATDKFHHTLTEAIVRLMALKKQDSTETGFEGFLSAHPELVNDLPALLANYYSEAVLKSATAKQEYVAPDLSDIV